MLNRNVTRVVIPAAMFLAFGVAIAAGEDITIDQDNLIVDHSVRIRPGRYLVKDADENGVLRITADNVVVDFQGATLAAGDPGKLDQPRAEGIGIAIEGANNVTIRNAKVHGYAFNIRAMRATGLILEGCDVSLSRAQRIAMEGQPIEIWLVLRSLEEWRKYGAGAWIEESDRSTVHACRGSRAQNGLLLVNSAECKVTQCDFSFNSGFGIGLWGSSRNLVAWNMIDFVNRPWGGGWGGDSAALVVVNSSHDNDLVGNSMTHSGDGFFLTDRLNGGLDGRTQTSNFEGNCNRNLVAYNDGSWSPCNAFEGTFSVGNIYYRNFANDSGFGYWLGFSNDSLLFENEMQRNIHGGIAIEHGSGTRIEANTFTDTRGPAIALWSEGAEWVCKLHPSAHIDIRDNVIRNCGCTFRLNGSTDVVVAGNRIEKTPEVQFAFADRPPAKALAAFKASPRYRRFQEIMAARPKGFTFLRDGKGPKGIPWLAPDGFAPRDYRGGLVAWRRADAASLELYPLVADKLEFKMPDWVAVSREPGAKLYRVAAKPTAGPGGLKPYAIEVRGGTDGQVQKLTGTFMTAQWDVRWYSMGRPKKLAYDDAEGWKRLFDSAPLARQTTRELSANLWANGFPKDVPHNDFAIVALTKVQLPAGRYHFSTLSDDGIRVFLDGKEIISRWNHHGAAPDEADVTIAEGVHELVVHYCQEDGGYALVFSWRKTE